VDNPGEPAPELSETLTQYTISNSLQGTPNLTSQFTSMVSLILKGKLGETAERNKKNQRTRTHTSLMVA